ncbi:hypothetical protein GH714_000914 [Hevea brasiliensis]|uniref:Uncharacterized protein n=1 Tax=Hevea brasiliensis TaxID=3981 RepID=A0A6A6LXM3_HEVBR|nr:hypothetical protein GH714_000914 [Hevea brasiliensis]
MKNAIAQAMIAKRIGLRCVVAAAGAGQYGVATAAACPKLSLECTVFIDTADMENQSSNVLLMKLLGAEVKGVEGCKLTGNQGMGREFRNNLLLDRYCGGASSMSKRGSGSNALGLFHEFTGDEDVRLIGVEAAGFGLDSGKHAATLARGEVGVYHGAMSYLLRDEEGQIIGPHSIGVG